MCKYIVRARRHKHWGACVSSSPPPHSVFFCGGSGRDIRGRAQQKNPFACGAESLKRSSYKKQWRPRANLSPPMLRLRDPQVFSGAVRKKPTSRLGGILGDLICVGFRMVQEGRQHIEGAGLLFPGEMIPCNIPEAVRRWKRKLCNC